MAGDPADPATQALLRRAQRAWSPRKAVLLRQPGPAGERLAALSPFTAEMGLVDGKAAAYVCRDFACQAPVTDPEAMDLG